MHPYYPHLTEIVSVNAFTTKGPGPARDCPLVLACTPQAAAEWRALLTQGLRPHTSVDRGNRYLGFLPYAVAGRPSPPGGDTPQQWDGITPFHPRWVIFRPPA